MIKIAILAFCGILTSCATGRPLTLQSNPERATVCFTSADAVAVCQETPYTVRFEKQASEGCFNTQPFRFTWQSGAQLVTAVRVCPGGEYFMANRPNLPGLSVDMAYMALRNLEDQQKSEQGLENLANAFSAYTNGKAEGERQALQQSSMAPTSVSRQSTYAPQTLQPPQMAPDGSWVSGGRGTTMCPDGTYVAGKRCVLAPNGKYVGAD